MSRNIKLGFLLLAGLVIAGFEITHVDSQVEPVVQSAVGVPNPFPLSLNTWFWDDGTAMTWDNGAPMEWDQP